MSYSFSIRAASKAEAKVAVAHEMAKTAVAQRCHARDMAPAIAVAHAFIDQLADDDSKDVCVAMNGSLTGHWAGNDVVRCEGASVNVSASIAPRAAP